MLGQHQRDEHDGGVGDGFATCALKGAFTFGLGQRRLDAHFPGVRGRLFMRYRGGGAEGKSGRGGSGECVDAGVHNFGSWATFGGMPMHNRPRIAWQRQRDQSAAGDDRQMSQRPSNVRRRGLSVNGTSTVNVLPLRAITCAATATSFKGS